MFKISNFTAEINKGGVLQPNRYLVTFMLPKALQNSSVSDILTLRCESAQMPGLILASADGPPRMGYGPSEKNPYNAIFDDINLIFTLDKAAKVHKVFYDWFNIIVNYQSEGLQTMQSNGDTSIAASTDWAPYEVGYKDDYVTTLNIEVYDMNDKKIMSAIAYRAFPKGMQSVDLAWANDSDIIKLPISFTYTDYKMKYY
jgi:hypothetical protein